MARYITSVPQEPITVGKGEHVCIIGIFTQGWSKQKTVILDVSRQGSARVMFLMLGDGNAAFPLRCTSLQKEGDSHVRICMRSALFGSSSVNTTATMAIGVRGHGSDAFFSHHILLLSEKARGCATPSLEIQTALVSAKHAASISTVDEEGLWYLKSKGCSSAQAMRMMVRGFLLSDSAMISDQAALQRAEHNIDSFLGSKKSYAL